MSRTLFLLPLIFSIAFANRTVKTFTFSTQEILAQNTPAGMVFNLPEGELLSPPGAPALPTIGINYPLPPNNAPLGIKIVNVEYETLPGIFSLAPAQPPAILSLPPPKPAGRNQAIYDDINPYPKEICRLVGTGQERAKPVAAILINPLQFLPLEGRVRLIKRLAISLEYHSQKDKNKDWPENGPLEYLIVTNSALDTVFAELLFWRHKSGFNGQIRLIEWITAHYPGRDEPEKLRNYMKICAQDSGLKWLVLGGDAAIIPVRKAWAMTCSAGIHPREDSLPCDLYYSDLDGDWDFNNNNIFGEAGDSVDLYPDIFVGRVPVKTPQEARGFLNKLLAYEKGAANGYQTRTIFAAAVLWQQPYTDEGIAKDLIEKNCFPQGFNPIYKLYESRMVVTTDTVKSLFNLGWGIFNHCGHGWIDVIALGRQAYLRNQDIDELSNANLPGIGYSIGCWTTAFDYDAIAEHFLTNPQGGGVAFIGNSSYGWGSPGNPGFGYSDRFDQRFFAEIFKSSSPRIGEILAQTKAHFIPYSYEANVYRWHQFCLNLLGDPAMPVHTDTLKTMIVHAPPYLPLGKVPIRLTVIDDNGPVIGAQVGISQHGKIYARGTTGKDGTVLLQPDCPFPGIASLTVTAANHKPVEKSIPIASGPNLSLTRVHLITSRGDTTATLSPNDTFSLLLTVRNTGTTRTTALACRLFNESPLITIHKNTGSLPSLSPDSEVSIQLFLLSCSPLAANGQFALAWLTLTDSTGFSSQFPLPLMVALPYLKVTGFSFTRTRNDTVLLYLQVANNGLALAKSPTGTIFDARYGEPGSPHLYLIVPGFILPNISPKETAWSLTPAQFAASAPNFVLGVNFATGGKIYSDTINLMLGESGLNESFDNGTEGWLTGSIKGNWHLSAKRCLSPPYSYCIGEDTNGYLDSSCAWLISPPFFLPSRAELKFYRWFSLPTSGVDGLYVILITPKGEDTIDFIGSGGALGASPAGLTSEWLPQTYDLSNYPLGESCRLKFLFVSDNDERTAEGFYIDDIQVTSAISPAIPLPETTQILSLFPNPVKGRTTIIYSIASPQLVRLAIFDITGRKVRTLLNEKKPTGYYAISWDGKDDDSRALPPGVYLLKILGEQKGARQTIRPRKMVKVK